MNMEDYSFYGAQLYTATVEYAKRCSDAYERDDFKHAQNYGGSWTPTRQLLIRHIRSQIDANCDFRRSIRELKTAVILEAAAIIAVAVTMLLL